MLDPNLPRRWQTPGRAARPGRRPGPDASVIVRCYNAADTLPETLDALVAQDWNRPWELLLSDNGSTDGSIALFEDYARQHPQLTLRVVDATERRGRPHAANAGVRAAAGRAVMFCDADDVPAPGWLGAMGTALAAHDLVAARCDRSRLNPDWLAAYDVAHEPTRQTEVVGTTGFPPYAPFAGLGTMGMRKSVLKAVGQFSNDFPVLEDADFCVRAHLAGFNIRFVHDALIHIRKRTHVTDFRREGYRYAKYATRLARRYRDSGPAPAPDRWRRFLLAWPGLARWYVAKRLLGRPETMDQKARRYWTLGWQTGMTLAVVRDRIPPI